MKDLEAEITCPNCRRKMKIKVKEMIPGKMQKCPSCNMVIRFSGDDGRKMQRVLDDFQRTLKRIGRRR